jgi:hypothetical protein
MAKKKLGQYPGIPSVVTPDVAEWLKANHPQYEMYAGIVDERLQDWKLANEQQPQAPAPKKSVEAPKSEENKEAVQ